MKYSRLPLMDNELIIVSDIHGNLDDFKYYLNLWLKDKHNHICFMGDLIHADTISEDYSLEILDLVKEYIEYPSFHVLLGNHELSQLLDEDAYRYDVNQTLQFKELVKNKYPTNHQVKYNEYLKLLSKFKYFLITSNDLFIIHSGIHEDYIDSIITGDVDIYDLNIKEYSYEKELLTMFLWSRPYTDYTEQDLEKFLKHTKSKYMISGHTNYNGLHIYGNQLIFDSSHNTENKYYLQIKLNKEYNSIFEIIKQLKEMTLK